MRHTFSSKRLHVHIFLTGTIHYIILQFAIQCNFFPFCYSEFRTMTWCKIQAFGHISMNKMNIWTHFQPNWIFDLEWEIPIWPQTEKKWIELHVTQIFLANTCHLTCHPNSEYNLLSYRKHSSKNTPWFPGIWN